MRPVAAAALALALAACRTETRVATTGDYGGTLVISVGTDADALFPPLSINPTSVQIASSVFEHLAEPGDKLNPMGDQGWTGSLADSWTWAPDSLSIAFHLDPRAHWHDGRPVRAADVRFTYRLYVDPRVGSAVGPLLAAIDSVSAPDSLTAVFWFKRRYPGEFFDAAYQMRILPEHLLAGADREHLISSEYARRPIGSGPYRFVRWVPRQSIELEADTTYHRGRPHIDRIIWSIAPDPNSAFVRVLTGEADFIEFVRPQDFATTAKHPELKVVRYPSLTYMYVLFNLRDPKHPSRPNPVFGDRDVRRALAMAVDRQRLVRSVFDTLADVALGPFTRALSSVDPSLPQLPFNPDSARATLEARGWRDTNRDGIREKDGRSLRFALDVPSSSTPRMQAAVLMQQMFRAVGAQMDINPMDFPTLGQRTAERQFDATIAAMSSDGNPSTIRQSFSSAAAQVKDGGNSGWYESPQFDALVDSAASDLDPVKATAQYNRAYRVLIEDAPGIWLAEPMTFALVQRRIHPVGMRADAWWAHLDRWFIPDSERTARDRIGFAEARP